MSLVFGAVLYVAGLFTGLILTCCVVAGGRSDKQIKKQEK